MLSSCCSHVQALTCSSSFTKSKEFVLLLPIKLLLANYYLCTRHSKDGTHVLRFQQSCWVTHVICSHEWHENDNFFSRRLPLDWSVNQPWRLATHTSYKHFIIYSYDGIKVDFIPLTLWRFLRNFFELVVFQVYTAFENYLISNLNLNKHTHTHTYTHTHTHLNYNKIQNIF